MSEKHGIVFFDNIGAFASNSREIEIPFVLVSSLYHLLGPTQCNKNRLLPNYNRQYVGPYMFLLIPCSKNSYMPTLILWESY
jgi:hypothetical protein